VKYASIRIIHVVVIMQSTLAGFMCRTKSSTSFTTKELVADESDDDYEKQQSSVKTQKNMVVRQAVVVYIQSK